MFCIYCGTRIPDHAAFCPACGAKVAVVKVEEKERPPGMRAAVCASCGSNNLKRQHLQNVEDQSLIHHRTRICSS